MSQNKKGCCNLCPRKYEKGAGITHCLNDRDTCPCHSEPERMEAVHGKCFKCQARYPIGFKHVCPSWMKPKK